MSRTVDLFIDSDQPLERVASQLGELTGRPLIASPDGTRFVFEDQGVTAYLSEHDFLDDDDLPLSEFRYVLSTVARAPDRPEDGPEAASLRRVNALLSQSGSLPSLLVLDLERPL